MGGGFNLNTYEYVPPTHPEYYLDNADPWNTTNIPTFNVQFDGMTVALGAQVQIHSGVLYHIKFAVADYNDSFYDSAVFVKEGRPCGCR